MLRLLLTLLAVLALAIAGCGGDDEESAGGGSAATPTPTATAEDSGGGGGGETLQLAAPQDGSLVFEPDTLTAKAGKVTIDFDNPSGVPHAVAIDGVDQETDEVTAAKTSLTVDLEPGKYTFYCPVTGHREAGMEGTLTVE